MKRFIVAGLLLSLLLTDRSFANESPQTPEYAPAIPVIIADSATPPSESEVDAALSILGVPLRRGTDIGRVMSLDTPSTAVRAPAELLKEAQNQFFEGDYELCNATLDQLITRLNDEPGLWITEPDVRNILFNALVYTALVANARGHKDQIDLSLRKAIRRFPSLTLSTRDFPPWFLEQHAVLRAAETIGTTALPVNLPEDCQLFIDGEKVEVRENIARVEGVPELAHATCPDGNSRVTRIPASPTGVPWRPVFPAPDQMTLKGKDLVLDATSLSGAAVRQLWVQLGRAGGWPRIAVIKKTDDQIFIDIVETTRGTIARTAAMKTSMSSTATDAALHELETELFRPAPAGGANHFSETLWYRDPLAWALLGTGIAAFTTGLVLGLTGGEHTSTEPAAITLQITGAATALAGGTLFFVPSFNYSDDHVAASAAISVSF